LNVRKNCPFLYTGERLGLSLDPSWIFSNLQSAYQPLAMCLKSRKGLKIHPSHVNKIKGMKAQKDFHEKKYNLSSDNHTEFLLKKIPQFFTIVQWQT
jgi:hypothetical protein